MIYRFKIEVIPWIDSVEAISYRLPRVELVLRRTWIHRHPVVAKSWPSLLTPVAKYHAVWTLSLHLHPFSVYYYQKTETGGEGFREKREGFRKTNWKRENGKGREGDKFTESWLEETLGEQNCGCVRIFWKLLAIWMSGKLGSFWFLFFWNLISE